MIVVVPAFDTDALRAWAEMHDQPPADRETLERLWAQLIADLLAAADHIETLDYARRMT